MHFNIIYDLISSEDVEELIAKFETLLVLLASPTTLLNQQQPITNHEEFPTVTPLPREWMA